MYYFNLKLQYLFLLIRGNDVIKKYNVKYTALFCDFYKGQGTTKVQTDGFKKEKRRGESKNECSDILNAVNERRTLSI